jgi:hypothetical protein
MRNSRCWLSCSNNSIVFTSSLCVAGIMMTYVTCFCDRLFLVRVATRRVVYAYGITLHFGPVPLRALYFCSVLQHPLFSHPSMSRVSKPRTSVADRLASRGFTSETLQSRVGELIGLKVFRNIAKPTQDAHNSMRRCFCEYLVLLKDARYTPEEVLSHGAPHLPLSMRPRFLHLVLF